MKNKSIIIILLMLFASMFLVGCDFSKKIEVTSQVSLGGLHSSTITSEGRIFTWGLNDSGQLGDGLNTNEIPNPNPIDITDQFNLIGEEKIISIELGSRFSSAVSSQGRLFTWGYNEDGELGDGTTISRTTPTEITNQFNLNEGETITSVSLGDRHSSVITSEGRIFTWGRNDYGQLGDGTTINRTTPTEITGQFSLNEGETITSVSLGGYHSSAITSEGRIFTWGWNYYGQLGDGTTTDRWTPTEITDQFSMLPGETITSVSLGNSYSSAITSEGRIFTWGDNEYGQLGDGTTTNRYTPTEITNQFSLNEGETIISVSLGSYHSAAITSEGRIFTWGYNGHGELGDGTTTKKYTPTEITNQFSLNAGETITSVSLGEYHSSASTSEGRTFTWGFNWYGQLGDGTTTTSLIPLLPSLNFVYSANLFTFDYNSTLNEYLPTREGIHLMVGILI